MSFIKRLEASYNKLQWTPSQVHNKLISVVALVNKLLPKGVFLQATKEFNDDIPIVRILLGPGDPYTAERLGSFAFYSTERGIEWYKKNLGLADLGFMPHKGMVFITFFSDLSMREEAFAHVNLDEDDVVWARALLAKVKTMMTPPETILDVLETRISEKEGENIEKKGEGRPSARKDGS